MRGLSQKSHLPINPSRPNPVRKNWAKFLFHTSLWYLKRFYEDLKGFCKTFRGTRKNCESKNLTKFLFQYNFQKCTGTLRVKFCLRKLPNFFCFLLSYTDFLSIFLLIYLSSYLWVLSDWLTFFRLYKKLLNSLIFADHFSLSPYWDNTVTIMLLQLLANY